MNTPYFSLDTSIVSAVVVMSPEAHTHDAVQNPLLTLVPNRKQLEQERLQRIAARERQQSTNKRSRSVSFDESTSIDTERPPMKQAKFTVHSQRYTPVSPSDRFWNGAIKVRPSVIVTHSPLTIDTHERLVQEHG